MLLAVESATPALSVALLAGRELVAECAAPPGAHHAETLLPLVERLLTQAGIREADVEAFGVSIGPGSFTSLRVGLATVKGLAFETGRPAVAVSTLAALAWGYAARHPERDLAEAVVALLDARRGELYAGIFDVGPEGPAERGAASLLTPAELRKRLPPRCVLVGDGVSVYEAEGVAGPGEPRVSGPASVGAGAAPRAASVGALAAMALARGEGVDPADLVPRYVRRAEAEVTRTAQKTE